MSGGHLDSKASPDGAANGAQCFSTWHLYHGWMIDIPTMAVGGLLLVNCWTVVRFWQDKMRAQAGERRIPEADLLGLALIGGSPGALLARYIFRHKTRKEPFSTYLLLIVVLQLGALIGLGIAGFA